MPNGFLNPTIKDVAEAAGVSIGTVSKALSGQGQLRDATRTRVLEAAATLGFRPNSNAQNLVRRRTYTIGLISADSYGRFSMPLLEGLEAALVDAQLSVFLCNAANDPARERAHVESLLAKRVDGIIVTGRRTDPRPPLDLGGARLPVLYAYAQTTDPDAACLLPDDEGGGALAAQHLIEQGRTRLAHITGPRHFEAVQLRRQGLLSALHARGLSLPPDRDLSGPWAEAWGAEAVHLLLDRGVPFDALFCGNDQIARGAADALRERGARVPEDVALVGYDNWEIMAAATRPPLTSIDMNIHTLGRQAARQLIALIDGHPHAGVQRLPCTLVVRGSSVSRPA